jgi:hypothetical protein
VRLGEKRVLTRGANGHLLEEAPKARHACPSDLSDAEWALLAPRIPATKPGGRARRHDLHEVLDALN